MFIRTITIFSAVVAALVACGGGAGGVSSVASRGELAGATARGQVSLAGVRTLLDAVNARASMPLLSSAPLYPVDFYRLTYKTLDSAGNLTSASGLLLVPAKPPTSTSPMLSWQHGTMSLESSAPSYADGTLAGTSSEAQGGFVVASLGYIVVMPDYLGYGAAKDIFHPYLQARTLASTSVDMVRASRMFLSRNNIAVNGQLFLAGYSEGGYATLATQREMETSFPAEFALTASAPGAGPYDLTNSAALVLGSANLAGVTHAGSLAFLLKAYDVYYNNPSRLALYFTAGMVLDCVNRDFTTAPTYGTDSVFGSFESCIGGTTVTTDILNPSFINSFNTGGEIILKAALAENDIYDWAPRSRTRLFYSTGDDVVPPLNTVNAYDAMVAKGAAQVQTVPCAGVLPATHWNCSAPYVIDVLDYFGTLAMDL
ncbi:MAG TPA: lipase family protein [Sideroxyarcus sp.]|nr:lipase family protein [Sideroxyarcus sp.]